MESLPIKGDGFMLDQLEYLAHQVKDTADV